MHAPRLNLAIALIAVILGILNLLIRNGGGHVPVSIVFFLGAALILLAHRRGQGSDFKRKD